MATSCKVCGLPALYKHEFIQKNGKCLYCNFSNKTDIFNYLKYKKHFVDRINMVRGKYNYDVLVGISGGKDGAYVLHKMINQYKLKVLTFTYNNCFQNKSVLKKVELLTKKFKVDHFYCKPKYLDKFYYGILQYNGIPCYACALAGYYLGIKLLVNNKIPFFIHGRSPFQMFRNLDETTYKNDLFFSLVKTNLRKYNSTYIKTIYLHTLEYIEKLLSNLPIDRKFKSGIAREFFSNKIDFSDGFVPESFAYFLTENYNEKKIRDTLREEASYIAPVSHSDCKIHNAANYLSGMTNGITTDVLEAATMLRYKRITRKEANYLFEKRRNEARYPPITVKNELKYMEKILSIKKTIPSCIDDDSVR